MKYIYLFIAFIVCLFIIDSIGGLYFILILLALVALLVLFASTKKKQKENTENKDLPIDYYTEATSTSYESGKEDDKPIRKRNRGTKPGFKFEEIQGHEKISKELLIPDLKNADPTDFFYNRKVVITGKFDHYERNEMAMLLKQKGADINTSISKKTDIVIIGSEPGPSKIMKIEELKSEGYLIQTLLEKDLDSYLL
jgi:NAD-dependent DNA ligase